MKVNKIILVGIILIIFSGLIFITDFLNPIIRPFTYLFLMGSSKGKDIMFFGLLGLFMILSQLTKKDIDCNKYLKISIFIGSVLLISGIILEIVFRQMMGISLNSTFCAMSNTMTSTSILHTHLLKSIFGEVITQIIGPFIGSDINTGVGLYSYLPNISFLVILLFPILFITLILSLQNRQYFTTIFASFFSSCLLIGILDGGLFSTPAIFGICGLILVYRNGFYMNYVIGTLRKDEDYLKENEKMQPPYNRFNPSHKKYILNRALPYIIIGIILILRFSIGFAGAETDYYTVEIKNIEDNVDFGNIPITYINNNTYHVNSSYSEMKLINDLKIPLNNSCEYYTVSWNIYTYFQ